MPEPRISVVTPTYDRAGTLPRLYESLCRQTFRDFEWVVIDDGSSDGTRELMTAWAERGELRIAYEWQPNEGKHAAVNRGIERARGELCAVMDSDDWYAPEALERMIHHWDAVPAERRADLANVEGLCADPDGAVIGDRFPAAVFDSNAFEVAARHRVAGDKVGMYRRDVLLDYPFPEDMGWHVTPAVVWNRIAASHWGRFVNEVWGYKEYLASGLTDRETELRLRYSEAQLVYWREFAAMPRPMALDARLRSHANYVRYSLLRGVPPWDVLRDSPGRLWTAIGLPVGAALWLRDRVRSRREGAR